MTVCIHTWSILMHVYIYNIYSTSTSDLYLHVQQILVYLNWSSIHTILYRLALFSSIRDKLPEYARVCCTSQNVASCYSMHLQVRDNCSNGRNCHMNLNLCLYTEHTVQVAVYSHLCWWCFSFQPLAQILYLHCVVIYIHI